jgi:exodeoxyribonuclease III
MKIITWNVNGIRSRIFNENISSKLKKNQVIVPTENSPIKKLLDEQDPDVLCIQETRCSVDKSKNISIPGYKSFFNESKLNDARAADRYSGTCVFYKENMKIVDISTHLPMYEDFEGRIIIITFENFKCISVYAPNSGTNYDKKIYFMEAMIEYLDTITEPVVFCGDLNVAISTHFDRNTAPEGPGIYKHEIEFYYNLLDIGFKDTVSDDIVYTWWDPRQRKENGMSICRNRNKGWRLDYFFTKNFNTNQITSKCLKNIGENNQGIPLASDHAPVFLEINY